MGLRSTQGDEKRLGPATTLYETVTLSFVIPSVAEGSAVSSLGHRHLRNFDNQALVAVKVAAPYSPSFTSPVNWLPATTPVKMKGTS